MSWLAKVENFGYNNNGGKIVLFPVTAWRTTEHVSEPEMGNYPSRSNAGDDGGAHQVVNSCCRRQIGDMSRLRMCRRQRNVNCTHVSSESKLNHLEVRTRKVNEPYYTVTAERVFRG